MEDLGYLYNIVLDDKRHQYQSQAYITEEETTQTKKNI